MKILLLAVYYLPEPKSVSQLIHDLGVKFQQYGHDVFIVATDNSLAKRIEISNEDNLTVVRIKVGNLKSKSRIIRLINEWLLSYRLWKYGKNFFAEHPCDLIVLYAPSIFFGGLVKKLKKLWGAKCYLIMRDLFPQWAVDIGLLHKEGLLYRFFHYYEKKQYFVADRIGVESDSNMTYFQNQNWSKSLNLEVLYNWKDIEQLPQKNTNYRQQLGLENKIVFVYGGNIGITQDVGNIVRLAKNLQKFPQVYFLLFGDGEEVNKLKKIINNYHLQNIAIYPAIHQNEYLSMLSEFDVGLVSLNKKLKSHNFPSKILDYLLLGMPVLASINAANDSQEILCKSRAGLVSINGEDELFCEHVKMLAFNAKLRQELGENAHKLLVSKFSSQRAAEQILNWEDYL